MLDMIGQFDNLEMARGPKLEGSAANQLHVWRKPTKRRPRSGRGAQELRMNRPNRPRVQDDFFH